MATTIEHREEVYSRPAARFDPEGTLEVRASAAGNCRRALWYAAAGHPATNPPTDEALTVLEAGNALEPVVLRAMERAGWQVAPASPDGPRAVAVDLGPSMTVTGHPDAVGVMPLFGGESVIEVKTRNPDAFKRWATLGAERSHPASVAQAALYTQGVFGEMRDGIIACMDTGSRRWDYEVIPAERMERALEEVRERLGALASHLDANGPDPDALPERDFAVGSWQCRSCPFLDACLPGMDQVEDDGGAAVEDADPVTDEQAREALRAYEEAQDAAKALEEDKRGRLEVLRSWLGQQGAQKARLEGRERTRTVGIVRSSRYAVDYRRLNALLDPEARAEIVTEQVSEYLRVS